MAIPTPAAGGCRLTTVKSLDTKLAALAAGTVVFIAAIGKWKLTMLTLSTVFVAAPVAGTIGLFLGILVHGHHLLLCR